MINSIKSKKGLVNTFLLLAIAFQTVFILFLIIFNYYSNQSFIITSYFSSSFSSLRAQAAGEGWYSTGGTWFYRKQIIVDHTKVANTDQVNFPILVSKTDVDLKDTSNGGHAGQTDGGDFLFTSSNGLVKLSHEIEKYYNATGELIAWVKIPSLSASADTIIYLYYGNDSVSNQWATDGSVWDSNYVMVQHMKDTTTSAITDSTSTANNGIKLAANEPVEAFGKIGNAQDFDGINDYISVADADSLDTAEEVSVEVWINNIVSGNGKIVGKSTANTGYVLAVYPAAWGPLIYYSEVWPTSSHDVIMGGDITQNKWVYMVMTWKRTGNYKGYIDGGLGGWLNQSVGNNPLGINNNPLIIGAAPWNVNGFLFNGAIDEVRISNIERSADWIKTGYNNQNSPSTFYAFTGEEYYRHLTITGASTMNAGSSQEIIITAMDGNGAVLTSYAGDKSITFSGANISINLNNPTCTDKDDTNINFGFSTTLTFTDGVANCTLKLYTAESISVDATDGTLSSSSSTSYDLDIAISSSLSGMNTQINNGDTYTSSNNVSLTLFAVNAAQMKFSNDNIAYSSFEDYAVSKTWDITNIVYGGTSIDGSKTVYVIFKDAYGNEPASVNDNIVYDTANPAAFTLSFPIDNSLTSGNNPTLSWTASSDPVSGLAKYQLYIDNVLDIDNISSGNISVISANPLPCGTHSWYIKAIDNAGNSTNSNIFNLTFNCGGGLPAEAYSAPAQSSPVPANPQGGFTISINDNASETNDPNVTLKFNAGFDVKRMAISESPEFTNASQEEYTPIKAWTLSEEEGIKTIYAKFFTQWGQPSEAIHASINYKKAFVGESLLSYPDGTLFKSSGSFKVYVLIGQKKKWIPTPEVFETLGYTWTAVIIVDTNTLKAIPDYEDNLIRIAGDNKVYFIVNGIRRHIPNPEIFFDYGFTPSDIKDISQSIVDQYRQARLIKESGQIKVYYLSSQGVKKLVPTPEIFFSYNNRWEDIQSVSKKELDSYPESNLMRYNNQIYLIQDTFKRLIPDETILKKYDSSLILDTNKTEFNWYKTGTNVQ